MRFLGRWVLALLVSCSGSTVTTGQPGSDAGAAPTPPGDPGPYVALGMNDATILAPAPMTASSALLRGSDTMSDGTSLVPRDLYERLLTEPFPESFGNPILELRSYERLQLVAVRFDLCDRNLPGACKGEADGRIRLVLQPFDESSAFQDAGFHAFYSVPFAEIAALVKDMRELARLQNAPRSLPLQVSPALASGNAEYRDKLRALIRRWTGATKLVRLTMNAQPITLSQVRWVMRGVEKRDGAFVGVVIPGITGSTEEMITSGKDGFEGKPASDTPKGMADALNSATFEAASDARKRELLGVLAAADNPSTGAPDTVSCIACHASTPVMHARATSMGIDPATVPGRFTSTFDLSVTGALPERRASRALGWLGREPMISQRVVNDTAQFLSELDARFPR